MINNINAFANETTKIYLFKNLMAEQIEFLCNDRILSSSWPPLVLVQRNPKIFLMRLLSVGLVSLCLKNTNTCNNNASKINKIKIINILFQKLRLILTFSSGWG